MDSWFGPRIAVGVGDVQVVLLRRTESPLHLSWATAKWIHLSPYCTNKGSPMLRQCIGSTVVPVAMVDRVRKEHV